MKHNKVKNSAVEILIAEDSKTQAVKLQFLLEAHGFSVVAAPDGKQALALARQRKPNLIISDVVMPELDGYGLCKAIKTDEALKDIPLILVTTLSEPEDVIRGLECGADNFVRKPYDGKYLLSRINFLLANLGLHLEQETQPGIEISLCGHKRVITANRQQILDLLISTYEQAIDINNEVKLREKDLAQSNQVLNGLYQIAEALNSAVSELDVAEIALDRAMEVPGVQAGWICLREGETGFRVAATRNLPPAFATVGVPAGDCACHQQLLSGALAPVTSSFKCNRLAMAPGDMSELHTHATVVLGVGDRAIGMLNLLVPKQELLDEDELRVLQSVGHQVAVALERAKLHAHLEKLVGERTATLLAEVEARKRIQEQQARLVAIIEATPDMIATGDPSGHVLYYNRAGLQMLGLPPETDPTTICFLETHPAWAAKRVSEEAIPYAIEHGSWSGETALIGLDGREIPVLQVIIAHKGSDGSVAYLSTIARDITELKHAEAYLLEREAALAEFKYTLDQTLDCVYMFQPDTLQFTYGNRGGLAQLGYSEAELLQMTPLDIKPEFTEASFREMIRPLVEGTVPSLRFETIHRHKDGQDIPVEIFLQLVQREGETSRFVAVVRDITQRKLAEEALQKSQLLLNETGKLASIGGFDLDMDTQTLIWTDEIYRIHEVPPTYKPTLKKVVSFYTPSSKPVIEQAIQRAMEHGESFDLELESITAKGNPRWVHLVGKVDQEHRKIIGSLQDITERKHAQMALLRLNEELEQRVDERTADLEQSRHEADEANRAKSAFLATMSHEIRTPMNGVIGMIEVLQQSALTGEQVEMADLIRESAFALLGIIDDVLDFSKIEAGKMEIERAPMHVAKVVEKACVMLNGLAGQKKVELTLFTDPAIPAKVLGDAGRVRQVLINLANNAIKFSSGGERSGRVSIRAVLSERSPEQVVVEFQIIDNGIGMDEATQQRLVTAFTQADVSTTRRFGGTGLGLVISRNLVDLMKGEFTMQSEAGKGSTFTVRLPFALSHSEPNAEAPRLAGLSCLVVGGPEGMAEDIATYLAYDGAVIKRAQDLAAAQILEGTLSPGPWIWVVDVPGTPPSLDELHALVRTHPEQDVHFVVVVIGRGQRRRPRVEDIDLVSIDGNGLTHETLLTAVAIAAGRAHAEIEEPHSGKSHAESRPPSRDEALRQGRLILMAEDNEINRKVIVQQLALLDFAADVVENGRIALESWRSGDYALLLTDLHMPEMDGYELTATIRAEEHGARRIPIVALTANALKGEADRCRAAGMDDYLSKPAQLMDLKATLEKWLPQTSESPPPDATKKEASGVQAAPVMDVDVLKALVGDDAEILREFFVEYQASARNLAEELRQACAAEDAPQVGRIAHKLKSSSLSVGALALGGLCAELERACNTGDTHAIEQGMALFKIALLETDTEITALLSQ